MHLNFHRNFRYEFWGWMLTHRALKDEATRTTGRLSEKTLRPDAELVDLEKALEAILEAEQIEDRLERLIRQLVQL